LGFCGVTGEMRGFFAGGSEIQAKKKSNRNKTGNGEPQILRLALRPFDKLRVRMTPS
jgi:hypothetical protein